MDFLRKEAGLKAMARSLIPPAVYCYVWRPLWYYLMLTRRRRILSHNSVLKGQHEGRRCFILATGPSILQEDLTPLQGELCISVSNFFVHPAFVQIQPQYHCFAPLHSPFSEEDGRRWFSQFPGNFPRTVILGLRERGLVEEHKLFHGCDVHYLDFTDDWDTLCNDQLDLTEPLPPCQSVTVMALMVALYLGCTNIYLLGTNHSVVDERGHYYYPHFYDGTHVKALGEEPSPPDLGLTFLCYAKLWHQYKVLRDVAQRRGVRIANATRGSLLDLFPSINYDTLLSRSEISGISRLP